MSQDKKNLQGISTEILNTLPKKSGVYLFKNEKNRIIYIGKAKNLFNRVRSYFSERSRDFFYMKPPGFIGQIKKVDYVVTSNEVEALILEGNLIKKNRPKYNVDLKDDKSYPFIAVTNEKYPRIFLTRNKNIDSTKYFGPYTDARASRKTVEFIRNIFKLRDCRNARPGKSPSPPCLNYHIGSCSAPCINNISESDYKKSIELAVKFLKGNDKPIINELKNKMEDLSKNLKFEEAAQIKNTLDDIIKLQQAQRIIFNSSDTWDFIAISRESETVSYSLFTYRSGALALVNNFILQDPFKLTNEDLLSGFISRYYEDINSLPSKIFIPVPPYNTLVLEEWFKKEKKRSVKILVPRTGEKKKILEMVEKNAVLYLKKKKFECSTGHSHAYGALIRLRTMLELKNIPRRIECYDISNLGESFTVGSMTVANDGELIPSQYRHFKIRMVEGQDDCAMLKEVTSRRLRYLYKENSDIKESFCQKPDLIVIDGGKAQFNAVRIVLKKHSFTMIDMISIAKKEEMIFSNKFKNGIKFYTGNEMLRIIIKLRDEAHRFALEYHRKLREKYMTNSILDEIKGIGEIKKAYILNRIGSIDALKDMGVDDIANIKGINYSDAVNIYNSLHR